jgi:N6-adenosine-specific RNA methylase IME4
VQRYRTIVADPPWPMPTGGLRSGPGWNASRGGRPSALPYGTMSLEAITELPVSDLAERDAHLYLWTVNAFLPETYGIARAWGFNPTQVLVWAKPPRGLGMGGAFTNTTEFVLFCRRGQLAALERTDSTWFGWSRSSHSTKPEAFLDLVERVSPAPRLELFARRNRLGWDTWGNESLEHTQVLASQQREREAVYGPPGSVGRHIDRTHARGQ